MDEKCNDYKEQLENNRNFVFFLDKLYREKQLNTESRFSSSGIFSKIAILSFLCGMLTDISSRIDSGFLKWLLFLVIAAIVFYIYISIQNFVKKAGKYEFENYIIPDEIRKQIRNEKESKQKDIISEVSLLTSEACDVLVNIRYRKSIPKTEWDKLSEVLSKAKKECKQYQTLSYFDALEQNLSKDIGLISRLNEKIK